MSIWYLESPWDESTMMTSPPASTRAAARVRSSGLVPMEAPTRSCLFSLSLDAKGKSRFFCKSVRAMSATSSPLLFRTGSFPFLDAFNISFASSRVTPSFATLSLSLGVMNSLTLMVGSSTKVVSRFDMIPTSFPPILPVSVMGMPEYPWVFLMWKTSATVASGERQTGSVMKPFLNFLTLNTSAAWSSMEKFEWMMPMPPCRAMVMAIFDSVTVSMGDETKGSRSWMLRVSWVLMSTS
mmetsp:Transcript_7913/g.16751  ORF Transcript_7913/g.16751 Transcript_7913/m.16751 type:complete len:239 (-) Transcript_7913:381-1097(-)